jgi:cystathionine beta-lyase
MKNIACVKDFLEEELPEVKLVEPEGTYLLWLDFRAWQLSSEELVTLFKRAGVCVNSGARYGKEGDGFIRMNIATQKATLQKALGYIKDASKMRVG